MSRSGGGGIRTPGPGRPGTAVFKTAAFDRSATPPESRLAARRRAKAAPTSRGLSAWPRERALEVREAVGGLTRGRAPEELGDGHALEAAAAQRPHDRRDRSDR